MTPNILYTMSAERVDVDHPELSAFFFQQQAAYTFCMKYCKHKTVLEIGSGSGYGANRIADVATSVLCIDKDKTSIEKSKIIFQKKNIQFICTGIEQFHPHQQFDVIISLQVIEHISPHHLDQYLRTIQASLKSNGICIFSTPNAPRSSYNENPYHYIEYSGDAVHNILLKYFAEVKLYGVTGDNRVERFEDARKRRVLSFFSFDPLSLRKLLPRKIRQFLFDLASFANRKTLNAQIAEFRSISEKNYRISPFNPNSAIDSIVVCQKPPVL